MDYIWCAMMYSYSSHQWIGTTNEPGSSHNQLCSFPLLNPHFQRKLSRTGLSFCLQKGRPRLALLCWSWRDATLPIASSSGITTSWKDTLSSCGAHSYYASYIVAALLRLICLLALLHCHKGNIHNGLGTQPPEKSLYSLSTRVDETCGPLHVGAADVNFNWADKVKTDSTLCCAHE